MKANITPEGTPGDPTAGSASVDPSAISAPAKKSKVRRNVLLAGSAVGLVGIGSTLAANISLNGGNNVEFGQGVAKTTACDEDGFTITPVTSYDNNLSIWRLDRVEISGLNLTPVGTGHDAANLSLSDAKAQHPGEYYDNGWKRTCDGVVLDFKAYTDDTTYWSSTREGYSNDLVNDISTPLAWAQYDGNGNYAMADFGFAVVFNTADDNQSVISNFAVGDPDWYGTTELSSWSSLDHSTAANSSFSFGARENRPKWRPNAAAFSKIAVASMATFPSTYFPDDTEGIGRG